MPRWTVQVIGTCLLVGVLLLAGCGPDFPARFPVSGIVKFADGSPVKTGTIEAGIPGSQWTATGEIDRNGRFQLTTIKPKDGAIAGEHKVIVRQIIVNYLPAVGGHDHGKLVDLKYADYRTSPLTLRVTEQGVSDVEFIVTEKTGR